MAAPASDSGAAKEMPAQPAGANAAAAVASPPSAACECASACCCRAPCPPARLYTLALAAFAALAVGLPAGVYARAPGLEGVSPVAAFSPLIAVAALVFAAAQPLLAWGLVHLCARNSVSFLLLAVALVALAVTFSVLKFATRTPPFVDWSDTAVFSPFIAIAGMVALGGYSFFVCVFSAIVCRLPNWYSGLE